jgi:hypothetical protein
MQQVSLARYEGVEEKFRHHSPSRLLEIVQSRESRAEEAKRVKERTREMIVYDRQR